MAGPNHGFGHQSAGIFFCATCFSWEEFLPTYEADAQDSTPPLECSVCQREYGYVTDDDGERHPMLTAAQRVEGRERLRKDLVDSYLGAGYRTKTVEALFGKIQ